MIVFKFLAISLLPMSENLLKQNTTTNKFPFKYITNKQRSVGSNYIGVTGKQYAVTMLNHRILHQTRIKWVVYYKIPISLESGLKSSLLYFA